MNVIASIILLLSISPLISNAAYLKINSCDDLVIEISNLTKDVCVLDKFYRISGSDFSIPLKTLMPGQSDLFVVGNGPDILMSYHCGNKLFSIRSMQSIYMFSSFYNSGQVLSKDPALQISYDTEQPSCGWIESRSGLITWTIQD